MRLPYKLIGPLSRNQGGRSQGKDLCSADLPANWLGTSLWEVGQAGFGGFFALQVPLYTPGRRNSQCLPRHPFSLGVNLLEIYQEGYKDRLGPRSHSALAS